MPNDLDFPKRLLVVALSAAFPAHSFAQAVARIDFAAGNVTASAPGGASRPLSRGAEVQVGETVSTQNGRAQMRFTDGAYVSLQPQTDFKVENYVFQGGSSQNESAVMSLLKGGMRTITGLIGKTNRDGYKLQTATATVGIRGTEYTVSYNPDGSITAFVSDGAVSVTNQTGTTVVPGGRSVTVGSQTSPPQTVDERPFLPPTGSSPNSTIPIATNVVQQAQQLPSVKAKLLTGVVGDAGIATTIFQSPFAIAPFHIGTSSASTSATLDAAGGLTAYRFSASSGAPTPLSASTTVSSGTSTVVSAGNDGTIAWGGWFGGAANLTSTINGVTSGPTSINLINPAFYVVGAPLPAMPTAGSAAYTMIGAIAQCVGGSFCSSASVVGSRLEVDFGKLSGSQATLLNIDGSFDEFRGPLTFRSMSYASSLFSVIGYSTSGTNRWYHGEGFLAGDNASRAGVAFVVEPNVPPYSGNGVINGVIAYGRGDSSGVVYAAPLLTGEVPSAGVASFDPMYLNSLAYGPYSETYFSEGTPYYTYTYTSSATLNAAGGLTSYSATYTEGYPNSTTTYSTTTAVSSGTATVTPGGKDETIALARGGSANVTTFLGNGVPKGNDGTIAWGEWSNGMATRTMTNSQNGAVTSTTSEQIDLRATIPALYVVGAPVPAMPTNGSAVYNMIGAITACAPNCSASVDSSKLEVDFRGLAGSQTTQMRINNVADTFHGPLYFTSWYGSRSLQQNGYGNQTNGTTPLFYASAYSNLSGNNRYFYGDGFFAGKDASRAGMAFTVSGDDLGNAQATAANPNQTTSYVYGYQSNGGVNGVIAYAKVGSSGADLISTTTLLSGASSTIVEQPEMAGVFNNSNNSFFQINRNNIESRVQFNAQGGLFSYENGSNNSVSNGTSQVVKGNDGSGGNDGIIAWGRWMNGKTSDGNNLAANGPFHYVVGLPATNLPTSGAFDFTPIGWTASCAAICSTAVVNPSTKLTVDYGTLNYSSLFVSVTLDPATSNKTFTGSEGVQFNGTRFTPNSGMTINRGGESLNFNAAGFLAGNQASNATARAGLAFSATGYSNAGFINTSGYGNAGAVNGSIALGNRQVSNVPR